MPRRSRKPSAAPSSAVRRATGDREHELAELLAAIARVPDDDAPRLGYADLVAELGDPVRAELIVLQLEREQAGGTPSAHEQNLIARYAERWLAPIAAALKKGSWTFSRGFLDGCVLQLRGDAASRLAGHPLWSTVRTATMPGSGDPLPILVHPMMQGLRVVKFGAHPTGLVGLLHGEAPIEQLH